MDHLRGRRKSLSGDSDVGAGTHGRGVEPAGGGEEERNGVGGKGTILDSSNGREPKVCGRAARKGRSRVRAGRGTCHETIK